ncbi:hypothetical protein ACJMK2_037276 [Sinanodonta woodiana]|uniref:ATP synthase subunit s-like protein n=1 Tax=Sinanodonta woodiana TaxID=1069815 RepID=A0ABD3WLW6_SINWO
MATLRMCLSSSSRSGLFRIMPTCSVLYRTMFNKDGQKWEGFSSDWMSTLHNLSFDKGFWMKKFENWIWREKVKDQEFRPQRMEILGPDLATATFIVARKGAVRFVGQDRWIRLDKDGTYALPNRKVDSFCLEAVDASGTEIMYTGLSNFVDLHHLRYLNFSNCKFFDDWCLSYLHCFENTLEFLDVSGCPEVTERGLATIHKLSKLKCLRMANLPKVKNPEFIALLLEDIMPQCTVVLGPVTEKVLDSKQNENELQHDTRIDIKTRSLSESQPVISQRILGIATSKKKKGIVRK